MGRVTSIYLVIGLLVSVGLGCGGTPPGTGGSGGEIAGSGGSGGSGGDGGGTGGTGGIVHPCADQMIDGDETDTDCGGGTCKGCGFNEACKADTDCHSNSCDMGSHRCKASCTDGAQDGTETDKDCGGDCATKCTKGQHCSSQVDCDTNACKVEGTTGVCVDPACDDGQLNSDEGDVDCGGAVAMCKKCKAGDKCKVLADCDSGDCMAGLCLKATCADSIQNQDESDRDCGGVTSNCDRCPPDKACGLDSDCASGICRNKICVVPNCTDGVKNQDESDKDCGGAICKPRCTTNQACNNGDDCDSAVCLRGACAAATCSDLTRNGSETDKDCGGTECLPCPAKAACVVDKDCQSGVCTAQVCQAPTCTDGRKNGDEGALDCGGSDKTCPRCLVNSPCAEDRDCDSDVCAGLTCAIATCGDSHLNGKETGVDCGGPAEGGACTKNADCHTGEMCDLTAKKCECNRCAPPNGCKVPEDCTTLWCPDGVRCASTPCGDSALQGNEQCDDGNKTDADGCSTSCTTPVCGDAIVQATVLGYTSKTFDAVKAPIYVINPGRDRGRIYGIGSSCPGDSCDVTSDTAPEHGICQALGYGSAVHVDWTGSDGDMDTPVMLHASNWSCKAVLDKVTDDLIGYTCTGGGDITTTPPRGMDPPADGHMLASIVCEGEQCDDGKKNSDQPDACRTDCRKAWCGDGIVDLGSGEQCDKGMDNSDSQPNVCRTNCKNPHCGDHQVDKGEDCDDGNLTDGDGCSSNCTKE